MRMYDIIRKKRDGGELTDEEIRFFIKEYTADNIPDYQASALMMAIFFKGMTDRETVTLTDAMANSGDRVDLSLFGKLSADKHSTGGVGDKTSLIVAPIVASLGGKVAKMSGRGLGHTGGTVDKLESIPGYRTTLSSEEFLSQIENVGMAIIGQSGNLTPADKKLYALRDVTATVDSIPLIASSIMSKKIAAGAHSIVLDVKTGSGAFMKTSDDAEKLACEMVKIGKQCGRNMAALITDMDAPLGNNIGNSLEIIEAVDVLKGKVRGNLREICISLAGSMSALINGITVEEGKRSAEKALDDGSALKKAKEWISAQGGDTAYIDDTSKLKISAYTAEVTSQKDGYIYSIDAQSIGTAAVVLGAGRASKGDAVDPGAGIIMVKNRGDRVKKGDTLCKLITDKEQSLSEAADMINGAFVINSQKPEKSPLIYKIIT